MWIPYEIKWTFSHVLPPVVSVFSIFVLMLLGIPIIGVYLFALIFALAVGFTSASLMGKNPLIQTLMGKYVLVADVNSTGIIGLYNARTINEENDRVRLKIFFPNRVEERTFDRSLFKRFRLPIPAVLTFTKEENEEYETLKMGVKKADLDTVQFGSEHFSLIFYNSMTGNVMPKPQLSEVEKALIVEHVNNDLLRETRRLNTTIRDFMRHTFDTIFDKVGNLLGNPMVQGIIGVLIIVFILFIIISFVPGAQEALLGSSKTVADTAANTGITPLPNTGIPPVGN